MVHCWRPYSQSHMILFLWVLLICHASHVFIWRLTWNKKSRDIESLAYYCLMSQNEVQKIRHKWDKHFLMKIQSSTVRSEIKISVASRESQCKYWYISNKNDLTSKISVYQYVWSIPWLKYVKGTGLQNKVFEYLTFKSGNFGKMSRESLWNGWLPDCHGFGKRVSNEVTRMRSLVARGSLGYF